MSTQGLIADSVLEKADPLRRLSLVNNSLQTNFTQENEFLCLLFSVTSYESVTMWKECKSQANATTALVNFQRQLLSETLSDFEIKWHDTKHLM